MKNIPVTYRSKAPKLRIFLVISGLNPLPPGLSSTYIALWGIHKVLQVKYNSHHRVIFNKMFQLKPSMLEGLAKTNFIVILD